MLDIIISRARLTFRVLDLRPRSLWMFLERKFVMALVPSFIDRILYKFTQIIGMIISRASLNFRVLGSRLLRLFLEKHCHCSSAYI